MRRKGCQIPVLWVCSNQSVMGFAMGKERTSILTWTYLRRFGFAGLRVSIGAGNRDERDVIGIAMELYKLSLEGLISGIYFASGHFG